MVNKSVDLFLELIADFLDQIKKCLFEGVQSDLNHLIVRTVKYHSGKTDNKVCDSFY